MDCPTTTTPEGHARHLACYHSAVRIAKHHVRKQEPVPFPMARRALWFAGRIDDVEQRPREIGAVARVLRLLGAQAEQVAIRCYEDAIASLEREAERRGGRVPACSAFAFRALEARWVAEVAEVPDRALYRHRDPFDVIRDRIDIPDEQYPCPFHPNWEGCSYAPH